VPWIIAIAAAAVIVLAVLVGLLWRRRLTELRQTLGTEQAALEDARRSTAHLETRVTTLRQELSEQHQLNAELTARLRSAGDSRAAALWTLERIRQSRLAGTPSLQPTTGPGIDIATDLRAALALELELLREEVGTYAEISGVNLGDPVSPREALAVLRVVQELAAALAKRADELRITVERDGDSALVTVVASGWTESTPNHGILERGVTALNGTLELRSDAEVLTAEVRIPDRAS
jgi:hypothetical protein